jgi:DNA-binding Lrp family transcriptional regulator
LSTELLDRLLADKEKFYQSVTKELDQYYYDLQDMVCVKFIKTKSNDYVIEFHVANDDFDTPIRLMGIAIEAANDLMTEIIHNINRLPAVLRAYNIDMSKSGANQTTIEYVAKMTKICITFIEKYEVCFLAYDDLNKPERQINFVLIGNLSAKPIKRGYPLSRLALRHTIRKLFRDAGKTSVLDVMMRRYSEIFMELCIVRNEDNIPLYH